MKTHRHFDQWDSCEMTLIMIPLEAGITEYACYVHSEVYRYCLPLFNSPPTGNAVKLSEICGDSFCDKVSQVAQDSQVSQVPQMR